MLYAIKSDTLFFNRQTNRVDLEAFSYLYPLADAALIRKMEGAEITLRAARLRDQGAPERDAVDQVFCAFLGDDAARGLHPLRRRLLPAARGRQVDGHRRHRQRLAGHLGAEPRLLEERRRVRAAVSSPTSAAPAAIGRWPRRSCRNRRSATVSALWNPKHSISSSSISRCSSCTRTQGRIGDGDRSSIRSRRPAFRFQRFPTRADYRFDELTVRVFIAAVDQFGQPDRAVGAFIERSGQCSGPMAL